MKLAFYDIEGWEEKIIKAKFPSHDIFLSQSKITPLSLPAEGSAEVLSIFVDSRLDKTTLDYFPNVKLIAARSTGYDHIDLGLCKERGVKVAFVPGYGDNTVAEFTFGLILNLTRKIYQAANQTKGGGSFSLKGLRGMDIKDKTLGVVGTGRIGREVIKIARGFGMMVMAFDPFPDEKYARELGFTYVAFEDLLKNSDVISIHCPYNSKTHHLFNQENIALIKPGAYIINTARGGIVETQALVNALDRGILAGVALDVLEEEGETKDELNLLREGHPKESALRTMLQNHILLRMPNVLITPHNAFNTQEALERILSITIENIQGFIDGKSINLVNYEN